MMPMMIGRRVRRTARRRRHSRRGWPAPRPEAAIPAGAAVSRPSSAKTAVRTRLGTTRTSVATQAAVTFAITSSIRGCGVATRYRIVRPRARHRRR